MKLRLHNIIDISDCKDIAEKYANIKDLSAVNPQPDGNFTLINNTVLERLSQYPYKSAATYRLITAVIRHTWGYKGMAKGKGYKTYLLSLSKPLLQKTTGLTEGQLERAIKEAESANIIIVKHNKGVRDGKNYLNNYYLFNKHYDTWVFMGIPFVGSSVVDSGSVDIPVVDNSIVSKGSTDNPTNEAIEEEEHEGEE